MEISNNLFHSEWMEGHLGTEEELLEAAEAFAAKTILLREGLKKGEKELEQELAERSAVSGVIYGWESETS